MKIKKEAAKFLPQELQDAINTFVEQFNIMEEYNLDTIPTEYTANLLHTMNQYPEYNSVLLDLIAIITESEKINLNEQN
tara:strand:- start:224 stop:460 length:237 start_codon:yes stop_codon:yes gene_type:complete